MSTGSRHGNTRLRTGRARTLDARLDDVEVEEAAGGKILLHAEAHRGRAAPRHPAHKIHAETGLRQVQAANLMLVHNRWMRRASPCRPCEPSSTHWSCSDHI